jgi:uncharacterized Zn finger protein (UPF0148 family)
MAEARCAVCDRPLRLFAAPEGPVTCALCHPLNETLQEERRLRIANQRKKVEAENRKLDKKRTSEAGEGFRQK